MRAKEIESGAEKRVLTGMIVSREVVGPVALKWGEGGLFRSGWANTVASWCVKYYRKHRNAPGRAIQDQFERWSLRADPSMVRSMETFLAHLSDEWETGGPPDNPGYILDLAGELFNEVRLERLRDRLDEELATGQCTHAQNMVAGWRKIELGVGAGITLEDGAAIEAALSEERESILKFQGALGEFFGDDLERGGFITFQGPEKRGKSFWLMEMVVQGILQRRRVAWFECGDMGQNGALRRLAVRLSGHSLKGGSVEYPVDLRSSANGPVVETETLSFDGPLYAGPAQAVIEKRIRRGRKSNPGGSLLRFSAHPNSSLSVMGMEELLSIWEMDGWVADIIVVDYADILDMTYPGFQGRDCINETWKHLRRLSQSRHALVVTATQTDAASYDVSTIGRKNFSDDKRKYAHVTGAIGLNQREDEKNKGIMRLNWILKREGDFSSGRSVWVAGCLGVANPAVVSRMRLEET